MTPQLDRDLQEIERLLPLARDRASKAGSMHALWDFIIDGEAVIAARQTLIAGDRASVAHVVATELQKGLVDARI
jgi:hypothetical protein